MDAPIPDLIATGPQAGAGALGDQLALELGQLLDAAQDAWARKANPVCLT